MHIYICTVRSIPNVFLFVWVCGGLCWSEILCPCIFIVGVLQISSESDTQCWIVCLPMCRTGFWSMSKKPKWLRLYQYGS